MEVKSIICPNCGASTNKTDYCEFCGSFLVGKVFEDIDVSSYVFESKKETINPGLQRVLKKYLKYIEEADESYQKQIWLHIIAPSTFGDELLKIRLCGHKNGIRVNCSFVGTNYQSRFENSPIYPFFTKYVPKNKNDWWNFQMGDWSYFDAGKDLEGLNVFLQLCIKSMYINTSKTYYKISIYNDIINDGDELKPDGKILTKQQTIDIHTSLEFTGNTAMTNEVDTGYLYSMKYNASGTFVATEEVNSELTSVADFIQTSSVTQKIKDENKVITDVWLTKHRHNEKTNNIIKKTASIGYPLSIIGGGIYGLAIGSWTPIFIPVVLVTIAIILLTKNKIKETMTIDEYISNDLPFYHITQIENLPSILQNGLKKSYTKSRNGICVVRSAKEQIISEIIDTQLHTLDVKDDTIFALIKIIPSKHGISAQNVAPDPIHEENASLYNYLCVDSIKIDKVDIIRQNLAIGNYEGADSYDCKYEKRHNEVEGYHRSV